MLRRVLLLRIGLKDIAVGADVTLLITVNVTILVPGCLRAGKSEGVERRRSFCLRRPALSGAWQLSARVKRHPLVARPMQKQWWPRH